MRIFIMILLAVILALMVLGYALLVIASRADERAERMYRKWKEEHDERSKCMAYKPKGKNDDA